MCEPVHVESMQPKGGGAEQLRAIEIQEVKNTPYIRETSKSEKLAYGVFRNSTCIWGEHMSKRKEVCMSATVK